MSSAFPGLQASHSPSLSLPQSQGRPHEGRQHQHQQQQQQQRQPQLEAPSIPAAPPRTTVASITPTTLRASKSYSVLADNIRALRETQNNRQLGFDTGNRRQNRPSPLQQSTQSTSRLMGRDSATLKSQSGLAVDEPRSPRERIEALFASEKTSISALTDGPFTRLISPTPSDNDNHNSPLGEPSTRTIATSPQSSTSSPSVTSHAQLRTISSPVLPTSDISPLTSPPASSVMLASRIDLRPLVHRNPSLDSAISTVSSNASQSTRSTLPHDLKPIDAANAPADIAGLITAAGSAEAALHSLWKERQTTQAHNAQLWRLLEKQRSMIMGLNQDLERALKDKERYRRKVKELTGHTRSTKNSVAERKDSALEKEITLNRTPSPVPTEEILIDPKDFPKVPTAISSADHLISKASPGTQVTFVSVGQNASTLHDTIPSSGSTLTHGSDSNATSSASSPIHGLNIEADGLRVGLVASGRPQSSLPGTFATEVVPSVLSREPQTSVGFTPISPLQGLFAKSPMTPIRPDNDLPMVAVTEATPLPDTGAFPSPPPRGSLAFRKNAPRPLNLANPSSPPPDIRLVSDSPLIYSPEEAPRGRRRTRADDDQVREVLVTQEEEEQARSRSARSKASITAGVGKATSKTPSPAEQAQSSERLVVSQGDNLATGLPASPRLPKKLFGLLSPPGSESSTASFAPRRSSLMSAPLLSPGLPMSPRPGDRPVNAPVPRPVITSKQSDPTPPLSPRLGVGSFVSQALRRSPPSASHVNNENGFQSLDDQIASALPPALFSARAAPSSPGFAPSQDLPTLTITSTPLGSPRADATFVPAIFEASFTAHMEPTPSGDINSQGQVYRGFVSEQFPGLLLPPNAIPFIDVQVFSSRMQPSRASILMMRPPDSDDPIFVLGIYARSDGRQLWRVEKTIQALPLLHSQLRTQCPQFDGKLPDRSLFTGHAPAKIDARRAALNAYFCTLLDTPLEQRAALSVCEFFSKDVIGPDSLAINSGHSTGNSPDLAADGIGNFTPKASPAIAINVNPKSTPILDQSPSITSSKAQSHNGSSLNLSTTRPRREGFLTKRGKNFGGWKARYFVLDDQNVELRYYDSPGGPQVGVIKLGNAQIGKQQQHAPKPANNNDVDKTGSANTTTDADENQYRHAFLILEPKRKDTSSYVRHVLCAESDAERDAWVAALLQYITPAQSRLGGDEITQLQAMAGPEERVFERVRGRDHSEESTSSSFTRQAQGDVMLDSRFDTASNAVSSTMTTASEVKKPAKLRRKTASSKSASRDRKDRKDRNKIERTESAGSAASGNATAIDAGRFTAGSASPSHSHVLPPQYPIVPSPSGLSHPLAQPRDGEQLQEQSDHINSLRQKTTQGRDDDTKIHNNGPGRANNTGIADNGILRAIGYESTVSAEPPLHMTDPLAASSKALSARLGFSDFNSSTASYDSVVTRGDQSYAEPLSSPTMQYFKDINPLKSRSRAKPEESPRKSSYEREKPSISGPTNGVVIENAETWGYKTPVKEKKRSVFAPFGRFLPTENEKDRGQTMLIERREPVRAVFGVPLLEAVEIGQAAGILTCLPAIVYRSVEFLRVRGGINELGIFRMSGSNLVVRGLKERFNTEGDIDLLEDEELYDIHAVASLLKLYLRELPGSILTNDLKVKFLQALETEKQEEMKVLAYHHLVRKLPRANHELLKTLCAFLSDVHKHSDVNKMNNRNLAIVFAPTLYLPVPLVHTLLERYDTIFSEDPQESEAKRSVSSLSVPSKKSMDSLRPSSRQAGSAGPGIPSHPSQGRSGSSHSINHPSFDHKDRPSLDSLRSHTGSKIILPSTPSLNAANHSGFANAASSSPSSASTHSTRDGVGVGVTPISNYTGATGKKSRRESSMIGFGAAAASMNLIYQQQHQFPQQPYQQQQQNGPPRNATRQTLADVASSRVPKHMVQSPIAEVIDESPVDRPMAKGLW